MLQLDGSVRAKPQARVVPPPSLPGALAAPKVAAGRLRLAQPSPPHATLAALAPNGATAAVCSMGRLAATGSKGAPVAAHGGWRCAPRERCASGCHRLATGVGAVAGSAWGVHAMGAAHGAEQWLVVVWGLQSATT